MENETLCIYAFYWLYAELKVIATVCKYLDNCFFYYYFYFFFFQSSHQYFKALYRLFSAHFKLIDNQLLHA